MSRDEIIQCIYENTSVSCRNYNCNLPEKEGNTGVCCLKCAEMQLKEYEDRIRSEEREKITSEWQKKSQGL